MKIGPLYIERPGREPSVAYLKARSMLRWLSAHRHLRVWVLGTKRWSILILEDKTCETDLTPRQALERVTDGLR